MKQELTKNDYFVKELDSNKDSLIGKDLVDNHGQVRKGMQAWRSVYIKVFCKFTCVLVYVVPKKVPSQVEC